MILTISGLVVRVRKHSQNKLNFPLDVNIKLEFTSGWKLNVNGNFDKILFMIVLLSNVNRICYSCFQTPFA